LCSAQSLDPYRATMTSRVCEVPSHHTNLYRNALSKGLPRKLAAGIRLGMCLKV
jgi:hypothetical protein